MIFVPVVLLLGGACLAWLVRLRQERVSWGVTVGAALLAWLVALGLRGLIGGEVRLPFASPGEVHGSGLILVLDGVGWRGLVGTATVVLSVALTGVLRTGPGRGEARALMLGYSALAMASMLAGSMLTLVLAWAIMDGGSLVLGRRVDPEGKAVQQLVTRSTIDTLALVLLTAAAAFEWSAGGAGEFGLPRASVQGFLILGLAGLLRLGLLPPHFGLPAVPGMQRGMGTLLRLLPAASVLSALARAVEAGIPAEALVWMRVAGAIGIAVGGLRWALATDLLEARRFLVVTICSVGVLGAALVPEAQSDVLSACNVVLLLAGVGVSLSQLYSRWHRLWGFGAGMMLLGAPLTPAAGALGGIATGSFSGGLGWVATMVAGMALAAVGAIREALKPVSPWPSSERLLRVAYTLGLALPFAVGLGIGVLNRSPHPGPGAAAFGVAAGLAGAGHLVRGRLSPRSLHRLERLSDLLDPDPLYRATGTVIRAGLSLLHAVASVIEGRGAMLWTFVIVILAWLATH